MSSSKQCAPETVARSFITKYYEKLASNPEDIHKFYQQNAFFTYADGEQDAVPVCGVEAIKEAVSGLPFRQAILDLSEGSVDIQLSEHILIVVTGDIKFVGCSPRSFVQTFFLAAQPGTTQFFVCNSIFRLLRVTAPAPVPAPITEDIAPVHDQANIVVVEEEVIQVVEDIVEPEAVEALTIDDVIIEDSATDAKATPEPIVEIEELVVEASPIEPVNRGPRSYRDMVSGTTSAPSSAAAPAQGSSRQARKSSPKTAASTTAAAPATKSAPAEPAASKFSLYVKYQDNVTAEDLKTLFSIYGKVVSAEPVNSKQYGFVEMETAAGLKAVLDAAESLQLNGRPVSAQERNASSKAGGSSGNGSSAGAKAGGAGRGGKSSSNRSGQRNGGGRSNGPSSTGSNAEAAGGAQSTEKDARTGNKGKTEKSGDSKQRGGRPPKTESKASQATASTAAPKK